MKRFGYLLILFSLFSCTKETIKTPASLIDTISVDKYYQNEIFTDSNLKLYGQWQFSYIYDDAGIIAGPGKVAPDYDYLVIKKYGIYGKIKDNKVTESGEIVVVKQVASEFQISLHPEARYSQAFVTWYYVSYTAGDSMKMMDASVGCGFLYNAFKKQYK